jgi:hypothetical protein
MVIGVGVGFAWMCETKWAASGTLAGAIVAILLAPFWLRQKIVWQKAAIPYLFRLSDFLATVRQDSAGKLQQWLDRAIRNEAAPAGPVIIVSGPLHAGKTSLSCGIATEAAFGGLKVRYTTFDKLAQMAHDDEDDSGPKNIGYWPWQDSQLLVIDDIDASDVRRDKYLSLKEFKYILGQDFGKNADCVGRRMSVWVLGQKSNHELKQWENAIINACAQQTHDGTVKPDCLTIKCQRLPEAAIKAAKAGKSAAAIQRAALAARPSLSRLKS